MMPIASSVGALSSSFRLRQRLTRILILIRGNAAELFPRKIRHGNDIADSESFPAEIEGLARDLLYCKLVFLREMRNHSPLM